MSTFVQLRRDLVRWSRRDHAPGGAERQPLRFVEVVINNPKSLSVVASQDPVVAVAVDRALARQADEVARYLSTVAVVRVGPRGAQREVGDLVVETARVHHLTSREGDPHRHVHLMLSTRARAPDGTWRGLHSAALRQHIRAVDALGSRALVTDLELRQALAAQGYTLGADGEVDQARAAVALLSKRSAQVAAARGRAEAAWRGAHPGREPSQRVRNGWDSAGWAEGRRAKPAERETPEQVAMRVRAELATVGLDLTPGNRAPVDLGHVAISDVDRDGVAAEAVAVLSGKKSTWSVAELTAEVEAALARSGVAGDPAALATLAAQCREAAAARCVSVLDPALHTPTSMSRHLSSDAVVAADAALNVGLGERGGGGARDTDAAAGVEVEVVDVEGEDLAGAGGSLEQHPPQGLLA